MSQLEKPGPSRPEAAESAEPAEVIEREVQQQQRQQHTQKRWSPIPTRDWNDAQSVKFLDCSLNDPLASAKARNGGQHPAETTTYQGRGASIASTMESPSTTSSEKISEDAIAQPGKGVAQEKSDQARKYQPTSPFGQMIDEKYASQNLNLAQRDLIARWADNFVRNNPKADDTMLVAFDNNSIKPFVNSRQSLNNYLEQGPPKRVPENPAYGYSKLNTEQKKFVDFFAERFPESTLDGTATSDLLKDAIKYAQENPLKLSQEEATRYANERQLGAEAMTKLSFGSHTVKSTEQLISDISNRIVAHEKDDREESYFHAGVSWSVGAFDSRFDLQLLGRMQEHLKAMSEAQANDLQVDKFRRAEIQLDVMNYDKANKAHEFWTETAATAIKMAPVVFFGPVGWTGAALLGGRVVTTVGLSSLVFAIDEMKYNDSGWQQAKEGAFGAAKGLVTKAISSPVGFDICEKVSAAFLGNLKPAGMSVSFGLAYRSTNNFLSPSTYGDAKDLPADLAKNAWNTVKPAYVLADLFNGGTNPIIGRAGKAFFGSASENMYVNAAVDGVGAGVLKTAIYDIRDRASGHETDPIAYGIRDVATMLTGNAVGLRSVHKHLKENPTISVSKLPLKKQARNSEFASYTRGVISAGAQPPAEAHTNTISQ